MRSQRTHFWRACSLAMAGFGLIAARPALAQVVINEFVKEERTAGSSATADDREFVELYNSGASAVNIGNWTLSTFRLSGNASNTPGQYFFTDTIPANTMIAPGDYYVMGAAGVPNVDQVLGTGELFQDLFATVMELRSGPRDTAPIVDAVGYDIFRAYLPPAAGVPPFVVPNAEQTAQISDGYWGQLISLDANAPNIPTSIGRYRNGVDTNSTGRDFGHVPLTPGASNLLPLVQKYVVPDVTALAVGTDLTGAHASFILPRVMDPTQVDSAGQSGAAINPKAIAASPQGGNAIMAWDETGGGNAIYSKERVNEFEVSAYIETTGLGVATDSGLDEWEHSIYGIGTTDPFFATPDPNNDIGFTSGVSSNGSTGVGWMIQRLEDFTAGAPPTIVNKNKLQLIDFGDGGNGVPAAGEWEILETIDLSTVPSGWYQLGIDYDPATGEVIAVFNGQTFTHTIEANLDGTFYVGYREGLTEAAAGPGYSKARPPTYDTFVPPVVVADADFDNDLDVDGADFLAWQRGFGKGPGAAGSDGDANSDGKVDAADFTIWRQRFGEPVGGAAAVPEPGALVLAFLGLAAAAHAAKFRKRR